LADPEKRIAFAYPGDLDTPTGGYAYDRRIVAGLRQLGWRVDLNPLGDGFPFPAAKVLEKAEKRLDELPPGSRIVIDGLAYGVMDQIARRLSERYRLTALVHHPLSLENGLSRQDAERLKSSEARALSHADKVIVTSPATADQLSSLFGIERGRVHVVLPGTEKVQPNTFEPAARPRLLAVGTVVPRKGHDLLLSALGDLEDLPWHLDIVGATDRDTACFNALTAQVRVLGLSDRVTFHGAARPEDLEGFYRAADLFVLASRYEGYGMAYTEAVAYGLPVIGSGGGAVKDTLPDGASIHCGVEDVEQLRSALELLIENPAVREKMATAARSAAGRLPAWEDAARTFSLILEEQA
jgi:glycosyltransferase involved in cell wall biosynthesis